MSILVVGTVAYDTIESFAGRKERIIGGSGMYVALVASKLYNKVNISSIVGYDFEKEALQKIFVDRNIGIEGIEIDSQEKTFFYEGKYLDIDINQRESLITDLNVLTKFNPILPDSYQDCKYLILGAIDPTLQLSVLNQLKERPKLVVTDTIEFYIQNCKDALIEIIKQSDILTVNDDEAKMITGENTLVNAGEVILSWGVKHVLLKKGEHGVLVMSHTGSFFSAPGFPLRVVTDPTGAGDSFVGGFVAHIAQKGELTDKTLRSAIIHGSCLASFCVEKFGNEKLLELNQNEIQFRLKDFTNLTHFTI